MDQSLKVLVVDDSSLYRRILTSAVASIPIPTEVETAPTGSVALKKIAPFGPDIVLLDIEMPEMSGLELQKYLTDSGSDMPIIFITAHEDIQSRRKALEAGARGFLKKPFEDQDLLDAVQRGLSNYSP